MSGEEYYQPTYSSQLPPSVYKSHHSEDSYPSQTSSSHSPQPAHSTSSYSSSSYPSEDFQHSYSSQLPPSAYKPHSSDSYPSHTSSPTSQAYSSQLPSSAYQTSSPPSSQNAYASQLPASAYQASSQSHSYSSQLPASAYQSTSQSPYPSQTSQTSYESQIPSQHSYSSQLPASAYQSHQSASPYPSQTSQSSYSPSPSYESQIPSQSYSSQLPASAYQSTPQTSQSASPYPSQTSYSPSYESQVPTRQNSYSSQLPSSAYQLSQVSSPYPSQTTSSPYPSQNTSSPYPSQTTSSPYPSQTTSSPPYGSQLPSQHHSHSSQIPSSTSQNSYQSTSQSTNQAKQSNQIDSQDTYQIDPSFSIFSATPSTLTGNRKALIIGINYFFNAEARLRGPVNDASSMKHLLLTKFGFLEKNIILLTDARESDPSLRPTRANIIKGITWLTTGVKPGDSLFFSYSGHGSQIEDTSGDEADGMDETILPVDYRENGPIIDDDLHRMLAVPIPQGARLTCIMDCCHSGTALDLPYGYRHGKLKHEKEAHVTATVGDVLLYSGCMDGETSADSKDLGMCQVFSGVLTFSFCQFIQNPGNITHAKLLESMQKFSDSKGFSQTIQLSAGRKFDIFSNFIL